MNRGSIGTYAWAECVPVDLTLPDVLRRLKRHFLGLRAANGDQPGSRRRHHREVAVERLWFRGVVFLLPVTVESLTGGVLQLAAQLSR